MAESKSSRSHVHFSFVKRVGNEVSHELAQYAFKIRSVCSWYLSPPNCILDALTADLSPGP